MKELVERRVKKCYPAFGGPVCQAKEPDHWTAPASRSSRLRPRRDFEYQLRMSVALGYAAEVRAASRLISDRHMPACIFCYQASSTSDCVVQLHERGVVLGLAERRGTRTAGSLSSARAVSFGLPGELAHWSAAIDVAHGRCFRAKRLLAQLRSIVPQSPLRLCPTESSRRIVAGVVVGIRTQKPAFVQLTNAGATMPGYVGVTPNTPIPERAGCGALCLLIFH